MRKPRKYSTQRNKQRWKSVYASAGLEAVWSYCRWLQSTAHSLLQGGSWQTEHMALWKLWMEISSQMFVLSPNLPGECIYRTCNRVSFSWWVVIMSRIQFSPPWQTLPATCQNTRTLQTSPPITARRGHPPVAHRASIIFFLCRRWRRAWKVEIWKYNHSIHQSLKAYLREHVPFNSQSRISLYLFFIFPEMYLKSSFVLRIIPALLRLLSPLALTCHQKQEENRSIYPSLRGMLSGHYSSTCHCFSLKRKKKKIWSRGAEAFCAR